jgi:hypothetical protein
VLEKNTSIIDMFGGNKFLMDHMRRQASLVHEEEEKRAVKKDSKGRRKSKHGTANGEAAFPVELSTLISEKPPKKQVLEYFQERIAKLVAEEMENA